MTTSSPDDVKHRTGTRTRRLFASRAEVSHRCYSQPLQRVVTDFGADVAFGQVVGKLREHYGVRLAAETVRGIVEGHTELRFGQQGRFTVDFYHVSDYLAAAKVCSPAPQAWLCEQQQHPVRWPWRSR